MTDRPVEPDVAVELDEMRRKADVSVIRLADARKRYHELRDGKSPLPVFPGPEAA